MDKDRAKAHLKSMLLRDIRYLCRSRKRAWSEPIVRTLHEIRETQAKAVFFGGTPRSLLVSRLLRQRLGRPRDVDIVVTGITLDALRERFEQILTRETRFGGLQLERMNWHFDVWTLNNTWAFIRDNLPQPAFSHLPSTTFLNLESIAVDVWAEPGQSRVVYSGDDQFFEGLLTRTLEVNKEDNPFPTLCVVRALILSATIDFAIGPRLACYLARFGPQTSNRELEAIQVKHYGKLRQPARTLRVWIEHVRRSFDKSPESRVKLPIARQQTLWPESEDEPELQGLRIRTLESVG